MEGEGSILERILELGIGISIAKQMPDLLSNCMGNMESGSMARPAVDYQNEVSVYAVLDETQAGPFSISDIKSLIQAGILIPTTLVWRQGMEGWCPANQVPEINKYFVLAKI